MNRVLSFIVMTVVALSMNAQTSVQQELPVLNEKKSEYVPVWQYWQEHDIFQRLDLSVNIGTTGVGLELSSPIGKSFQLRGGFSVMPKFHHNMTFGVQVGETNDSYKFNRLSDMMQQFTGYKVNNSVDMIGEPTWSNAHILLDIFPFKKKHWHLTAGLFYGPSKVAKAYNSTEDMPSLMGVTLYNQMYEKAIVYEPIIDVNLGTVNYRLDDPDILDGLYTRFLYYGRMGVHIGDYTHDIYDAAGNLVHEKGKPYMVEPDADCMIKVNVKTNSLRPYVGFGYEGRLIKGSDSYKVSFDCGAMFWGGKPRIYTHDGTDLSRDVENIGGKVGTYVDVMKAFKVFPVLNLRFTTKLF